MKRNLIIGATVIAAIAGGARYKAHTNYWSFFESCQEARQARRDASRLLGQTIMSGHGGMASDVAALIQDANDLIAKCNTKGV